MFIHILPKPHNFLQSYLITNVSLLASAVVVILRMAVTVSIVSAIKQITQQPLVVPVQTVAFVVMTKPLLCGCICPWLPHCRCWDSIEPFVIIYQRLISHYSKAHPTVADFPSSVEAYAHEPCWKNDRHNHKGCSTCLFM